MIGWFKKLFAPRERDDIRHIRSALGEIIAHAIDSKTAEDDELWAISLRGCRLRKQNVGDWQITARPINYDEIEEI